MATANGHPEERYQGNTPAAAPSPKQPLPPAKCVDAQSVLKRYRLASSRLFLDSVKSLISWTESYSFRLPMKICRLRTLIWCPAWSVIELLWNSGSIWPRVFLPWSLLFVLWVHLIYWLLSCGCLFSLSCIRAHQMSSCSSCMKQVAVRVDGFNGESTLYPLSSIRPI